MKSKIFILLAFVFVSSIHLEATPQSNANDSISVYVFLHESCIISQYYTLPLREMNQQYANEQIQFVGLFPDFSSKPDQIESFKKKYQIPFQLKADYYHQKKEALGATVTPEVVVYNETKGSILYKGRIDDAYARIGQRKRVTSTSELKDVLEAIKNDQPILIAETQAVGCFIRKTKLN